MTTHVLVAYGSKHGGTEGLARMISDACTTFGLDSDVRAARDVHSLGDYDAVIVVGALYAARWHRDARRLVKRSADQLREMPVWLASSGPLDASASVDEIAPTPQVARLMNSIGAQGHMTFGGRLESDVKGFIARSMAKKRAGDWRDTRHVREWVSGIARFLQETTPTS